LAAGEHDTQGIDPHTWFNPSNVQIWAKNFGDALSALDPAQAEAYATAVTAYQVELDALDGEIRATLAKIPEARRKLVTDHDNLGYLADAYGFTIVGSVIPSLSTMAAASAQELARLQDQVEAAGVPAIFVGTTVNPQVAEQLAGDLGITVVPIYTDALSEAGGPAATYTELMRSTVKRIAQALQK
jgi:manganese/iron transport system substrate-binding protein